MAFGEHWEWRGFGPVGDDVLRTLRALPLKFPDAQVITDEYLWSPGCRTNVKLRLGDLKLKRFVRVERGLELWREDPGENYAFPIGEKPLAALFEALGVRPVPAPGHPLEREALLVLLRRHARDVRVVSVDKSRRQYEFVAPAAESGRVGSGVTVELAEISAPERILSIGLEHERLEAVARARDVLDLERRMRRRSYFEALRIWAEGGTVGGSGTVVR